MREWLVIIAFLSFMLSLGIVARDAIKHANKD